MRSAQIKRERDRHRDREAERVECVLSLLVQICAPSLSTMKNSEGIYSFAKVLMFLYFINMCVDVRALMGHSCATPIPQRQCNDVVAIFLRFRFLTVCCFIFFVVVVRSV